MIANFSRVRELADIDELVFWRGQVREAARSFADLAERFRFAPSRSRTPSVLKHDINKVFAVQAGELLCHCWRRGMLAVYRPNFYLTEEGEARLRNVFSWFTFIRWHLAPIYKNRFRADWRSEFAPEMDQLRGQKVADPADFTTQFSNNHSELLLWRLGLYAEVQATACTIFVEELERLLEAIDQHRGQLPEEAKVRDAIVPPIEPEPPANAQVAIRLLNVYTNGLADERLTKATDILNNKSLNVDEMLWKIDALMPLPPVSAAKLGKLFTSEEKPDGVSKTAIQNTSWYKQNREGRKDEETAVRRDRLRQRGKTNEQDRKGSDDE